MKLFLPVSGFQNCLKIQLDLNKLSEWCDGNSLLLNVGKCKTILTFAISRQPVKFSYMLGGTVLDRVHDLGVIMDKKMTFSERVDVMVAKAFAMLGFIGRFSLEFRDPYSLKSLYTSLVRPKLEYASCVWNPFYVVVLTEWNACRCGLFDMLCMVWVGRTCMISHHMRTDAPFCILKPLRKSGRLLVICLISMFWVGE
jgi:hypothetical protein